MDMKLAENIRTFRKERSLTQEQLSEVLGVTAGAVYKWEAGLSVPDSRTSSSLWRWRTSSTPPWTCCWGTR